jgi:hypothetical protein
MAAIKRALIVGAGMAGMTLGLALKRSGIDPDIAEIRPSLSEPGTGISLQGPALRALREVGVLDACISRGFAQTFFKACDAEGNVADTVELPRFCVHLLRLGGVLLVNGGLRHQPRGCREIRRRAPVISAFDPRRTCNR